MTIRPSRRSAAAADLLGAALLTAALASIAGCGGDDGSSAVDAGATLDGGRADDGGTVVDGSGGSDGGAAVDAGSDAGAPGERTFPGLPDGVTPDGLARAAVLFAACVPDDGIRGVLRDTYLDPEQATFSLTPALACLAAASDGCAAVERCFGLRFDLDGPCSATCDEDRLTVCDDEWRFSFDCAALGLSCDAAERACVDETAPLCGDATSSSCLAGTPTGCSDGRERSGYACTDFGLACVDGDRAACAGQGGACTSSGTAVFGLPHDGLGCASNTELDACLNGGRHTIDCADIGTGVGCHEFGGHSFCGLGADCDATAPPDATCDGTSIEFCNAGQISTIDCVSLGFTGCASGVGRDGAYCTPSAWLP